MYVCGITVYDYCHIGHGRMLIVFDLLRRHLRESGYRVTFVRNITDIDDKIIRRAEENGEPIAALTERFIRAYQEDCAALGVELGDHEPRATEYVPQIIDMVARLIERGQRVSGRQRRRVFLGRELRALRPALRQADRGSARRRARRGRREQARSARLRAVEGGQARRARLGIALGARAVPAGTSSARRCRWRCSARISTSTAAAWISSSRITRTRSRRPARPAAREFVNVWMHNGFVRVDEEKMSKSLGNFFTVREVLDLVRDPEVIRYFMLSSHYRGPINYSLENLEQADAALERLYNALQDVEVRAGGARDRRRRSGFSPRWTTISIRRSRSPSCRDSRASINSAKAAGDGAARCRRGRGARRARDAAGPAWARSAGLHAQGAEEQDSSRVGRARIDRRGCRTRGRLRHY